MSPGELQRLHGMLPRPARLVPPATSARTARRRSFPWWDPAADAEVDPDDRHRAIDGVPVGKGSLVRVHPSPARRRPGPVLRRPGGPGHRGAADVDGETHVALVLVDDPAADLHDWYGRYLYFAPDELEPLDRTRGEPSMKSRSGCSPPRSRCAAVAASRSVVGARFDRPTSSATCKIRHDVNRQMTVLVAGIGNLFLGDDGFGPEVVRRLADGRPPPGVRVVDYGIRGMHLAYDLLDGYDALVLVDALPGGRRARASVVVLEVGAGRPRARASSTRTAWTRSRCWQPAAARRDAAADVRRRLPGRRRRRGHRPQRPRSRPPCPRRCDGRAARLLPRRRSPTPGGPDHVPRASPAGWWRSLDGYADQLALVDVVGAQRRVNVGMLDEPPAPGRLGADPHGLRRGGHRRGQAPGRRWRAWS